MAGIGFKKMWVIRSPEPGMFPPFIKESYILVTGADGEEYICPKSALKKKSQLTEKELKECIPESVTGGGASIGG